MISELIEDRIKLDGGSFLASDNISKYIKEGELESLELEVKEIAQQMLRKLIIDTDKDHNTNETAKRLAKMYIREIYKGRYLPEPRTVSFPNAKQLDEIYTVGPITVRSSCSHHLAPIVGHAWIGIVPSEKVIGLSKFSRIADWILSRPHIQEEAVIMLADKIEELIKPKALAVVIRAKHLCMTWRGVKEEDTSMVTSVMRGLFITHTHMKDEFINIIKGQGF